MGVDPLKSWCLIISAEDSILWDITLYPCLGLLTKTATTEKTENRSLSTVDLANVVTQLASKDGMESCAWRKKGEDSNIQRRAHGATLHVELVHIMLDISHKTAALLYHPLRSVDNPPRVNVT